MDDYRQEYCHVSRHGLALVCRCRTVCIIPWAYIRCSSYLTLNPTPQINYDSCEQTNKQFELKSRAETRVLFEVVDDQCEETNEEQGACFVDVTSGKETVDFAEVA